LATRFQGGFVWHKNVLHPEGVELRSAPIQVGRRSDCFGEFLAGESAMTKLAWEARGKFNLEMRISDIEKKTIAPIRRMAQNDRKKAKEKGIPLNNIAEQRLAQTRLEFQ